MPTVTLTPLAFNMSLPDTSAHDGTSELVSFQLSWTPTDTTKAMTHPWAALVIAQVSHGWQEGITGRPHSPSLASWLDLSSLGSSRPAGTQASMLLEFRSPWHAGAASEEDMTAGALLYVVPWYLCRDRARVRDMLARPPLNRTRDPKGRDHRRQRRRHAPV